MTQTFTTAEAAKHLKCAPQKIRDLINHGHLEAVNTSMGSTRPRWVITAQAIETFQQSRQSKTPQKARKKPPTSTREWI